MQMPHTYTTLMHANNKDQVGGWEVCFEGTCEVDLVTLEAREDYVLGQGSWTEVVGLGFGQNHRAFSGRPHGARSGR